MKLTYRGVSYDYTPNPVPQKGSVIGTRYLSRCSGYVQRSGRATPLSRRLIWSGAVFPIGRVPLLPLPPLWLKFWLPPQWFAEPAAPGTAVAETSTGVIDMARNLFIRHHQRMRRREQGMMVRLAAEVGIPVEDAAHYESHIQGKLPHDFSGYDRSSTAMS